MIAGRVATVLAVASGSEAVTGAVLIIRPAVFAQLVLGGELPDAGEALARLGGFTLIALVLACWPRRQPVSTALPALQAMLVFSLLAALYLAYVGCGGSSSGPLLWPAVGLHAVLAFVLAPAWLCARTRPEAQQTAN